MENNCFVKKFKNAVSDASDFPIVNSFEIEIGPGDFQFYTKLPYGVIVSWDDDDAIVKSGSITIISPYTHIYPSSRDRWNGTLTKKTKFTFKGGLYVNEKLQTDTVPIFIDKLYLESMLKYAPLNDVYSLQKIESNGLYFDLADTKHLTMTRFYWQKDSGVLFYGDISELSNQTTASIIRVNGDDVIGNVESLVTGLIANGKAVGTSLQISLKDTNVKFHTNLSISSITSGNLNITITSTGATIADNDNVTIATYTSSNNTWTYL